MNNRFNFLVNKDTTFLNFGSFGSCPLEIFNYYQDLQLELEKQPVEFIVDKANDLFENTRTMLSRYLNCSSDDLVLMTNPSYAINTVVKSLPLKAGDEVLSTNLEYGALVETWKKVCKEKNAKFVEQSIKFPIKNKTDFLEKFWLGCNENTKAIFISHITSSTAIKLPVEEICKEANKRGLISIIDGAHAPGQIDLDFLDMKPTIYVGACHKWMLSPKGASFLFANKKSQRWLKPLIISWGSIKEHRKNKSVFIDEHQTNGTRDLSALLSVSKCLDFMERNNWKMHSFNCAKITLEFAQNLSTKFHFNPICPLTSDWIGQMFSIPVISEFDLRSIMKKNYNIEIPMTMHKRKKFLRFSFQAFNDYNDLEVLDMALTDLQEKKMLSFN